MKSRWQRARKRSVSRCLLTLNGLVQWVGLGCGGGGGGGGGEEGMGWPRWGEGPPALLRNGR